MTTASQARAAVRARMTGGAIALDGTPGLTETHAQTESAWRIDDAGRVFGIRPSRCGVAQFAAERANMLALFGEQAAAELDYFLAGWRQQLAWYTSGQFGYEAWVLERG